MKHLVVTTDFSPLSWKAIPMARMFAELFSGESPLITLLAVDESRLLGKDTPWWPNEPLFRRLEDLRGRFLSGVNARSEVIARNRSVSEDIAEYARVNRADMVVLASHGRSGVKRLLAGSVAERVVAFADCPVLVVPAAEEAQPVSDVYRIVVTTDLSEESELAFPLARKIYQACGSQRGQLSVVHLAEDVTRATFGMTFGASQEKICTDIDTVSRERLSELTAKHFPGLPVMPFVLRANLPRIPALLQYIGSHNADLIITARHGASGLAHALFGSFTRALISSSHRNVLIVPSVR